MGVVSPDRSVIVDLFGRLSRVAVNQDDVRMSHLSEYICLLHGQQEKENSNLARVYLS